MKLPFSLSALAGALLLGVSISSTIVPYYGPLESEGVARLEMRVTSPAAGVTQIFYDTGRAFTEADSATLGLTPGAPAKLVFPIHADKIRGLRFDPINGDAAVTVEDATLVRSDGEVIRRFSARDFEPLNQVDRISTSGEAVTIHPTPGANDPFLRLQLGAERLSLPRAGNRWLKTLLLRGWPWAAVILGLVVLWNLLGETRRAAAQARGRRLVDFARNRPRTAVALSAATAMVLSSYPVIFCGASFVSPNYGSVLLYDGYPSLPGAESNRVVDVRGADVGAIMWSHVPASTIQSRALLRDFEFPLWNRYNSGGTVLLGQGQTMFGDPLHLGVILAGGAAWAWDIKYLVAKWLLGVGLGLTVLHTARHLGAALLVAFAAIFAGFFVFRVNHPAYFSFCYGPLILYAWCHVVQVASRRSLFLSLLGLIAANGLVLASGTAKEAYVSLFTLNFAGGMMLACSAWPARERVLRLAAALGAGAVFMLLTAPLWLTFLDAMKSSYTSYNAAFAFQLQPSLALGFFDEVLLRPFWENEQVFNPSSNFLILLGVLAYLVNLRALSANRNAVALGLAALFPLVFVFGLVPARWIVTWPYLGNIHHLDNSFGIGLIHLFAVLGGFGFARAAQRLGQPEGRGDLALGGLLLGALVLHYLAITQTVQRSTHGALAWGQELPRSEFVWGSLASLLLAAAGLALAARSLLRRRALASGPTLIAAGCVLVLLWRHGIQLHSRYPAHTMNAAPRVEFATPSPALTALKKDAGVEPARVAGFKGNLFPGWSDVYDIEGIAGPDALMNGAMRELQTAFGLERIWDWRVVVTAESLPQVRAFFDLFNVRYFLGQSGDAPPAGLPRIAREDLDVFRNDTAWPRAFFTNRVATYASAADFARLVRQGDRRPLAAVLAGDRNLPSLPRGDLSARTVVPASDYKLTTNTTRFTVQAPSAGVVVLAEAWLPDDFKAEINGQPASYFRVNHAFKGLYVPQGGTYRVSFRYRPHRFNFSLGLSALGALIAAGAGWWTFRRFPAAATAAPVPDAR